ncbi:hypothetical protein MRX96_045482 [Rhipicephalus microplus]
MDASLYDQGCLARLALSNKLGCTGRSNAAGASRSIRLLIQAFEVESKLKQGRTQESIAWKSSIFECAVFAAVPCPRKVGLGGRIYVFAAVHIPMDASLYDQGCLARLALSNKLGCTGRSNAAGASRSILLLIQAFEVESKLKQGRTQESIAWKSSIFECAVFAAVPCPRKVGLGGRIYVFAAVHIPMDASLYDQGCLARLALSNKLCCTGRSNAAGASRSIRLLIQAFEVESKLKQGRTQESIAWKSSIFECAVFAAVPCPRKIFIGFTAWNSLTGSAQAQVLAIPAPNHGGIYLPNRLNKHPFRCETTETFRASWPRLTAALSIPATKSTDASTSASLKSSWNGLRHFSGNGSTTAVNMFQTPFHFWVQTFIGFAAWNSLTGSAQAQVLAIPAATDEGINSPNRLNKHPFR